MKNTHILLLAITLVSTIAPIASTNIDDVPIPADRSLVNKWFIKATGGGLKARKDILDPALLDAEANPKIIRVGPKCEIKTLTAAINAVPAGNTQRHIIKLCPGKYKEKVTIPTSKPFITLIGQPGQNTTLSFGGTAAQYGTVDSATLIVHSDYFVASNLIIENSAPAPGDNAKGQQAVAFRVRANYAALYNVRMLGYQDTLCDDRGYHFYKDCYIEGTVDFIFGKGHSLFLSTHINVLQGVGPLRFITAQARQSSSDLTGYSIVHAHVYGVGKDAYLGRAWMTHPKVVFSYSILGDVVNPIGWSNNLNVANEKTVWFGEYKNSGPGADPAGRPGFVKMLTDEQAKPFLSLAYIDGSKWLMPPPKY